MHYASIGPIAVQMGEIVEDNEELAKKFPHWDLELIRLKTGIRVRYVAGPGQFVSDLGVAAAEKLFEEQCIERESIDFLLFCTQTPDYPLPTTACLVQERLGLRTSVGALDFNLGCSGFVYGLALADGLIRSGAARRILLITSETYSKYIDPGDRALRTIFSDAAAATLIDAAERPSMSPFIFGTDGRGADTLMVTSGAIRNGPYAMQPRKRKRWPSSLHMDGPELVKFALDMVPPVVHSVLEASGWGPDDVEVYLLHQATAKMLELLRDKLALGPDRMPIDLELWGNTVSSTIPLLIRNLRKSGRLKPGSRSVLLGFGVGLSWAGCGWTDTWQPAVGC